MQKTYEIKTRCQGEVSQYFTLKLMVDGILVGVHTGKKISYIMSKVPAGYKRS